ncbi:MAG: hypothetical protein Q7P63_07690 [Verrucomicrobiota bacterium JB022]|nr:hypothetical protein [Verrucomicrobiota bacterium JB022]
MARPRFILAALLVAAGLLGALLLWQARPGPAPIEESPEAAPPADGLTLHATVDPAQVFRRAFWRHPAPNDALLHAERREWTDEQGVAKWQWFLALQPGPETLTWLEANPFTLRTVAAGNVEAPEEGLPRWFPSQVEVSQGWRSGAGTHLILIEASSGTVYATDQGLGHAPAVSAPPAE